MRTILVLALFAVAACGADGEPQPVEGGINVTAEARIGVTGAF